MESNPVTDTPGAAAGSKPLDFTAEIGEYVVLRLELEAFRGSARQLPAGFQMADPAVRVALTHQEKTLLQRYFRHWKGPHRGRLKGWRADSPILVTKDGNLVAGVYLCVANEFDGDPAWGQLHYAFMEPACKGQGIYSVMFREAVERARRWGLRGLYLNSDRHQLPEVYERWGAVPWKRIAKAPVLPPKPSLWQRIFRTQGDRA